MFYNINMTILKWNEAKKEIQKGTVFLEFFTSWCGDCKMMDPIVENAENEISKHRKDVKFIKVNAEEANLYKDNNSNWEVLKVPSFFIIKNGDKKHIGYEYLPIETLTKPFIKK